MNCKDCLYGGICSIQLTINDVLSWNNAPIIHSNNVENECLSFRQGSRFIQLPCNTGQKVYVIFLGRANAQRSIYEGEVIGFQITASRLIYINVILDDGYRFVGRLGRNIFLTPEEAEKDLKGDT